MPFNNFFYNVFENEGLLHAFSGISNFRSYREIAVAASYTCMVLIVIRGVLRYYKTRLVLIYS